MVFCNNFYQRKRLGHFFSTGKPRAETRVAVSALRACVPGHSLRQSPSTQVLRSCHTHPRESGWVIFCVRKLTRLRTVPPYKLPSSPYKPATVLRADGRHRSASMQVKRYAGSAPVPLHRGYAGPAIITQHPRPPTPLIGWVIFCARKLARLRTVPPYKLASSTQPACLVAAVGALRSSATGTCGQKALATLAPFPRMTPPRFRYAAPTSATPDHPPLR